MHQVYVTTHIPTGRFYIGVHHGGDSGYMGSGNVIVNLLAKYPPDEFCKQIVEEFKTGKEAYAMEAALVDEEMLAHPLCLNLCGGGRGVSHHVKETRQKLSQAHKGKKLSEETKEKIGRAFRGDKNHNYGKPMKKETKQKLRDTMLGRVSTDDTKRKISNALSGRTLSEEHKRKLSKSKQGEKNPSYKKPASEETKQKMSESRRGQLWWNDGQRNTRSVACP